MHIPGQTEPLRESLGEGEVLLVGRRPSRDDVPLGTLPAARVREVTVASRLVSATHLLAWREGTSLHLRDPASRNGTSLHAPSGALVRVDAEGLTLELAAAAPTTAPDRPAPARWSGDDDFAEAVARDG